SRANGVRNQGDRFGGEPLEGFVEHGLTRQRDDVVRRDDHAHAAAARLLEDDVDGGGLQLDEEDVGVGGGEILVKADAVGEVAGHGGDAGAVRGLEVLCKPRVAL